MPLPQNIKELRGLIGRLQFIRRFISQHVDRCKPFYELLNGGREFTWDEKCQKAFDELKAYLMNPPVLSAPMLGKPLLLYVAVTASSIGVVLAQHDEDGKKEKAIYYLSRTFLDYEEKYTAIEKHYLVLVWASQKLRHYFLAHKVCYIANMDPIKYTFEKLALSGRLARWHLLLIKFDLQYVS